MNKTEMRNTLYKKYGTFVLSRKQVANELNKSVATIDRWKKQGIYLKFIKRGKAKNAAVEYPLDSIIDYLTEHGQMIS